MGTEVLRPQDCLTHRIRVPPAAFHRRKTTFSGYTNRVPPVNKPFIRTEKPDRRWPEQRKRSPEKSAISKRSASSGDLMNKQAQINSKNNVIASENVRILRRGESLMSIRENEKKCEAVRVGLADVYSGSTATMSPSPRALPVPSFFKKGADRMLVDDLATKDLRRLLRLD
ncbi:hypothetical protein DCAR_0935527 [Daucus carota subsp. sativus]|uniref:Uncharacterized protein n=1 Tax=Daucus carota subsp. sativus TaxID=79200 RepID=A0A175YHG9_DAUCS|nr:PREDICTED: uncharacterized protein LOC108201624 [Daucus carota subsp. sativus]WOH15978.1 hypothetical protein DCAR_0935527 [Daucus carota subsp. sativus]